MRILLIDNNMVSGNAIVRDLKALDLNHVHWCHTMDEGLNVCKQIEPHLVILNASGVGHLAGGLQPVWKTLKQPVIVLATSNDSATYQQVLLHHPEAFMTFPIDQKAFHFTLKRIVKSLRQIPETEDEAQYGLYLKRGSRYEKVVPSKIKYLVSEGNYVSIFTDKQNRYVLRGSLLKTLESLPSGQFIRIHRNYAINKYYLLAYDTESNEVNLGEYRLPVGRNFRSMVRDLIVGK